MYCPNCKTNLSGGSYCPNCGTKLMDDADIADAAYDYGDILCAEEDFYADLEDDMPDGAESQPVQDDYAEADGEAASGIDGERYPEAEAYDYVNDARANDYNRGDDRQNVRANDYDRREARQNARTNDRDRGETRQNARTNDQDRREARQNTRANDYNRGDARQNARANDYNRRDARQNARANDYDRRDARLNARANDYDRREARQNVRVNDRDSGDARENNMNGYSMNDYRGNARQNGMAEREAANERARRMAGGEQARYSAAPSDGKRRFKFNFSKPLCLLFALLLLVTMVMPWVSISIPNIKFRLDMAVFSIQPRFSEYADMANTYAPLAGIDMAQYADVIWLINGILLIVTAFFLLIALNIILFGLIGLFDKGRTRYFFARVGSTMYIIGLCVMIAAVLVGSSYLRSSIGSFLESQGIKFDLSLTFWPVAALILALLFRIFGIRWLRYLNGISCMNRGDRKTAVRELTKIHKLEYIKPNHSGGNRYNAASPNEE